MLFVLTCPASPANSIFYNCTSPKIRVHYVSLKNEYRDIQPIINYKLMSSGHERLTRDKTPHNDIHQQKRTSESNNPAMSLLQELLYPLNKIRLLTGI